MKKFLEPLRFQGFSFFSRQVGKTTLLQKLMGSDRKYVTLDALDVRYLGCTPPVLIDVVQSATELLPYIKMSADRSHRKREAHRLHASVLQRCPRRL